MGSFARRWVMACVSGLMLVCSASEVGGLSTATASPGTVDSEQAGLLWSTAHLTAGATDDTVAPADAKAGACQAQAVSQVAASEECYRVMASAYAVSAISMGQIFAAGPRR